MAKIYDMLAYKEGRSYIRTSSKKKAKFTFRLYNIIAHTAEETVASINDGVDDTQSIVDTIIEEIDHIRMEFESCEIKF